MKAIAAVLFIAALATGCGATEAGGSRATDDCDGTYPGSGDKIQVVVGYSPGGSSDLWVRTLASALEDETGARFEVLNKEGGGGQIGQAFMLRGPDDGSLVSELSLPSTLGYLYSGQEAPYTKDSFKFVASTGFSPNALVVASDSPYKNLDDLIAAAKKAPGKLNAAFNGAADDAIIYTLLEEDYGVSLNKTVYDGGSDKAQALLAGQVGVSVGALSGVADFVEAGQFRLLAVFSNERNEFMPDVPTAKEQGVDIVSTNRWSIAMDAAVDECKRDALEAAIKKVSENDDYIASNADRKVSVSFMSHDDFSDFWDEQEELVTRAAKSAG